VLGVFHRFSLEKLLRHLEAMPSVQRLAGPLTGQGLRYRYCGFVSYVVNRLFLRVVFLAGGVEILQKHASIPHHSHVFFNRANIFALMELNIKKRKERNEITVLILPCDDHVL